MGWLNTILDVASVGFEIAQLNKLDDLRRQGAEANLIVAVLQVLRNQIFNYRQAAQTILEAETEDPKIATGAMRLLELRLDEFGLTPSIFPDFNDKEYVAATIKIIRDNSHRMRSQLSTDNVMEIEDMAKSAINLPDYNYYLDNYEKAYKVEKAKSIVEQYQSHNSLQAMIGMVLLIYPGAFIPPFLMGILCEFTAGGTNKIAYVTGMLVGIGLSIAMLKSYGDWMNRKVYKQAKKEVEQLSSTFDLERFTKLDSEFRSDRDRISVLKQEAETRIHNFFGSSPLLPS